jgi:hypothetical protein
MGCDESWGGEVLDVHGGKGVRSTYLISRIASDGSNDTLDGALGLVQVGLAGGGGVFRRHDGV